MPKTSIENFNVNIFSLHLEVPSSSFFPLFNLVWVEINAVVSFIGIETFNFSIEHLSGKLVFTNIKTGKRSHVQNRKIYEMVDF